MGDQQSTIVVPNFVATKSDYLKLQKRNDWRQETNGEMTTEIFS
jgi:hypothetical protein